MAPPPRSAPPSVARRHLRGLRAGTGARRCDAECGPPGNSERGSSAPLGNAFRVDFRFGGAIRIAPLPPPETMFRLRGSLKMIYRRMVGLHGIPEPQSHNPIRGLSAPPPIRTGTVGPPWGHQCDTNGAATVGAQGQHWGWGQDRAGDSDIPVPPQPRSRTAPIPVTAPWALTPLFAMATNSPVFPMGSGVTTAVPRVPETSAPDTVVLVCAFTAAFVAVAIVVVVVCRCWKRCCGRTAQDPAALEGNRNGAAVPMGAPKSPED
ncbi:uncharacterized protein LOC112532892 isoform X1 [Gallus gallus]|uniref:uncharacterized protein LOC112532892 isoform X1 n=1 Tax=Gallus gallus TaxID=9031 RepID=UPI001AE8E495|nr:uncharacterized protein LOC112532892 isoform X1 [Gallus gallus]